MGNALGAFIMLYLITVGWQGRASDTVALVAEDAQEFVPVLFAIFTLLLLYNSRAKPIVAPFITLAVITTILTRSKEVERDIKTTYALLTRGPGAGGNFGGAGASGDWF